MLLSIIIPIYNVKEYLTNTLNNVLSQNFKDFELILVDDGSTDGSAEICDAFAEKDSRVKVIHKENGGVSSARNTGVVAAQGKYIGFVDSDDLIEPNMFEILIALAEKHDAEVVECSHNRLSNVQSTEYSNEFRIIDGKTFVNDIFGYSGGKYTNQVALWSKIYRRELFKGITFPVGQTYEDEQGTYKLCLKAQKIVMIPDELYHYVRRENSIITGISPKKMIDKQLALLDRVRYLPQYMPELEKKCVQSFVNYSKHILCSMFEMDDKEATERAVELFVGNNSLCWRYLSKYDKLYLKMLGVKPFRSIILKNDFEPVQRLIRAIRRK